MHRLIRLVAIAAFIAPVAVLVGCVSQAYYPEGLEHGWWGRPIALATLCLVSWSSFSTTLPGVIGWLAGMGTMYGLGAVDKWCYGPFFGPGFQDAVEDGLPALLIIQGVGSLALLSCERAWSRRIGESRRGREFVVTVASLYLVGTAYLFPDAIQEAGWAVVPVLALAWWACDRYARVIFPPPGRWVVDGATALNSLCGYGAFIASCLTLPLFLPLALVLPGGRRRWIAAAMRRAMRFVFWSAPTVTWRHDGELAALDGARVVVANHEGMLDILAACALPGTRTLLAKTWVFRAFPLGVAARAAGLRNSDALLADDYQEGAAATAAVDVGAGILVFPEGRRSRSGAIDRFRPGAFVLARSLGAPVVPVAVAGSRLGIRPGSMWIHPTRVCSRVLPPMRQGDDESIRQFAGRCRQALAAAHFSLLAELLGEPRLERNRLHHYAGLRPALQREARAEHRAGAWRVLLGAVRDDDAPWLAIGCGWSTLPVTLRQLLPASAILAIEAHPVRRAVARSAWFQSGLDALVADPAALALPERLAGVVCLEPWSDAVQATALAALATMHHGMAVVPAADAAWWQGLAARARESASGGGIAVVAYGA